MHDPFQNREHAESSQFVHEGDEGSIFFSREKQEGEPWVASGWVQLRLLPERAGESICSTM